MAASFLTRTLLREALAREQAAAGSGDAFFAGIRSAVVESVNSGGQQMTSASVAGKSFTFGAGFGVQAVADALDDAESRWVSSSAEELQCMLQARRRTRSVPVFGCGGCYL